MLTLFLFSRQWRRLRLALLLASVVWCTADMLLMAHTLFAAKLPSSEPLTGRRVFIASLHWNNEDILRDGWSDALVELVERLRGNINGYSNVYVSVYESGSWDGTKAALQELDVRMGQHNIARRIVIDNTTHADVMASPPADGKGWVKDEDGKSRLRRIPYLAGLRNKVLEPLWEQQERGVNYDHILFLEDVLFRANEVETLLSTNNGNYEAACAVDVKTPPYLYDTFALRDNEGHAPLMLRWPWFRSRESRDAALHAAPVPVQSCWNGMVAMRTEPFYKGLRFRGLTDSLATHHLEASECCLVHADNAALAKTKASRGVWVNLHVQVGYNRRSFDATHPPHGPRLSVGDFVRGIWWSRLRKWTSTTWFQERIVDVRLGQWRREDSKNKEVGRNCIINEMQVLVENGWAHV